VSPKDNGPPVPIPFVDLAAQQRRLGDRLHLAVARVLAHGQYVMGPEIAELERRLAGFCGARHAIACASGTDALGLGLMALGLRPGDAVLVPAFTFAATAEVVAWLGAVPVFVDVRADSFNMDAESVERGIAVARDAGLVPQGIITVDLFGQPADYDALEAIAEAHGLWILADAAQSFGSVYRGRRAGAIGRIAATSFYPAKPLGCYGDGGAVFTDDDDLAGIVRSLRIHGQGTGQYDNVRIGMNGRMDTLQAAILLEKLEIFPEEIAARQAVAARYEAGLGDVVRTPQVIDGAESVWAQYTLDLDGSDRAGLSASLKEAGVPTVVYYPRPLHHQPAYRHYPAAGDRLPASERLCETVLSLPIHGYLPPEAQDHVVAQLRAALAD
jgi:dTDP-4-amino-4,6-dideoxygalactose transaminase